MNFQEAILELVDTARGELEETDYNEVFIPRLKKLYLDLDPSNDWDLDIGYS